MPAFRLITVEISSGLVNCFFLFRAHAECLVAVPGHIHTFPYRLNSSLYLLWCTAKPFTIDMQAAHLFQLAMNFMIHKRGTILSHSRFFHPDMEWRQARTSDVVLLIHTVLSPDSGIAHLQQTFQIWVVLILIRIDGRIRLRLFGEIFIIASHRLLLLIIPSDESSIR